MGRPTCVNLGTRMPDIFLVRAQQLHISIQSHCVVHYTQSYYTDFKENEDISQGSLGTEASVNLAQGRSLDTG